MPSNCLHEQAVAILDDVEAIVGYSELDVACFLPLMETVNAAIESKEDRRRILRFLDNVEARGFGIAREYRQVNEDLLQLLSA